MAAAKIYLSVKIDEAELKMAVVNVSPQGIKVLRLAAETVKGASNEVIADHIRVFAKENKISRHNIVCVLPSSTIISKNIEIPSVDPKEIKDILDLQASRQTPFSRNEIIIDYMTIGIYHERYTKIMLLIIKRDVIVQRYDIFKLAGLEFDFAFPASLGIARLFSQVLKASPDDIIGIIHVDFSATDFIVFKGPTQLYIRTIAIGASQLAEGTGTETQVRFCEELKTTLDSYQSENIDGIPMRFILTGVDEDAVGQCAGKISEIVKAGIERISSHELADCSSEAQAVIGQKKALSFLDVFSAPTVCGKAPLNLIPEEVKLSKQMQKRGAELITAGILAMVFFLIICANALTNVYFNKQFLSLLTERYLKETQTAESLTKVVGKSGLVKAFLKSRGKTLTIFTELFSAIPQEMYLSDIAFSVDDVITMKGTADSMSRVFLFVTELENSPHFSNVKIDFTKSRKEGKNEVADFGITMKWATKSTSETAKPAAKAKE